MTPGERGWDRGSVSGPGGEASVVMIRIALEKKVLLELVAFNVLRKLVPGKKTPARFVFFCFDECY